VIVLSILKLVVLGLNTLLVASLVGLVAAFDQNAAYRLCLVWVRINLLAFGVRVRARRLAALDPAAAYVFMSNHRSQLDVLAVVEALREFQLRWVAKKELTRIPIFGWALRHAGHVIIDRSDHAQAVASLRAAREQMLRGVSVIIFPEGTRAPTDDALLPFKKGGFMLALETEFPIVPIAVRGSRSLLPKGSWRVAGGEIDVVVGAPIAVAGESREGLMERVRGFMAEQLGTVEPAGISAVRAEAV
jgi:1-acyl-sn-glycerol-3-phosphate acyltransferase